MTPKFADCTGCKFFMKKSRIRNPICGECGVGEFYEPRGRTGRELTENELMSIFRRMNTDD